MISRSCTSRVQYKVSKNIIGGPLTCLTYKVVTNITEYVSIVCISDQNAPQTMAESPSGTPQCATSHEEFNTGSGRNTPHWWLSSGFVSWHLCEENLPVCG